MVLTPLSFAEAEDYLATDESGGRTTGQSEPRAPAGRAAWARARMKPGGEPKTEFDITTS